MNLIEENLWLGGVASATDTDLLLKNNIKSIVTIEIRPLPPIEGIDVLFIQAQDDLSQDLLCLFEQAHSFIDDGKKKGGVLVHCFYGVSRSAALVISYLQKKYLLTRDEALCRVQLARPSVMPNEGFMSQLSLYENHLKLGNFNSTVMRWYHLQRISRAHFKSTDDFSIIFIQTSQANCPIKCKHCRFTLCDYNDAVQHKEGKDPDWRDTSWVKCTLSKELDRDGCKKGIFLIPSPWMKPHSSPQGKLLCPKCSSKLGSYNWNQPVECPCKAKFQPAFYFVPSKVDIAFKTTF